MRDYKLLMYFDSSGFVKCEEIKGTYDWIELPDGYHPQLKGGVKRDASGKYPPIMIYYQDLPCPEGVNNDLGLVSRLLRRNHSIKEHKGTPSISKRWVRLIVNSALTVGRIIYFGIFLFFMYGVIMILNALFGAGMAIGVIALVICLGCVKYYWKNWKKGGKSPDNK